MDSNQQSVWIFGLHNFNTFVVFFLQSAVTL